MGWLEEDPFLLGPGQFSGAFAVSFTVGGVSLTPLVVPLNFHVVPPTETKICDHQKGNIFQEIQPPPTSDIIHIHASYIMDIAWINLHIA